jgi:integrase
LENRCALADVEKFTSHDLRHCASTWAVAKGCSPWYIQSLLGHADLRTTLMYVDKQVLEGTKVVQKALLETREKALQSHTA